MGDYGFKYGNKDGGEKEGGFISLKVNVRGKMKIAIETKAFLSSSNRIEGSE